LPAYIQRLRLQACVRDLQAAGPHGRPITDIAMTWGFGNLSHFSRVFREHTGASPSEFRNTSQAGQPSH
jgi:AraC-like DNA-binding protein